MVVGLTFAGASLKGLQFPGVWARFNRVFKEFTLPLFSCMQRAVALVAPASPKQPRGGATRAQAHLGSLNRGAHRRTVAGFLGRGGDEGGLVCAVQAVRGALK